MGFERSILRDLVAFGLFISSALASPLQTSICNRIDKSSEEITWKKIRMAANSNLTLVMDHTTRKFHLENQAVEQPGPGEVQVQIHTVGICGTDLHFWHAGHVGDIKAEKPHILGHESSGVITKVGANVTNVKLGDRVVVEPSLPCWKCVPCLSGRYNHCLDVAVQSTPPHNGHLRKYLVHPAIHVHKIPDSMSIEEGSMVEPLVCAIWACKRGKVEMGKKVFIVGAGSIGLLCMLVAKAVGASTIVVADVKASRIEAAKRLGADAVIQVDTKASSQDLADKAAQVMGCKPQITMDCSGTQAGIQAGLYATAMGGTVVLVGLPPKSANLPILEAVLSELDVVGSLRFVHCFDTAIEFIASGKVDVKPLMTHRFKLQEADTAFQTALSGDDNAIKVALAPIDS